MALPPALYRAASLRAIEARHAGQPLMHRAGLAAAAWAVEIAAERPGRVLVLAGPGNNGGDAWVAALELQQRGIEICLVSASTAQSLPPDAAAARARYLAAGLPVEDDIPIAETWSLIIDGLFGIGLTRAPGDPYATWIGRINAFDGPVLALDVPSGLDADTGRAFSPCVRATHTLTFIGGKPGLLTGDGPDLCGELRVAALDLTPAEKPDGRVVTREDFAVHLKRRAKNTHKGTFGSVGVLGGSRGMLGAALLAGRAALKLGAGRVYLGLLDPDAPGLDPLQPELMLRRANALLSADLRALACGPGLGQSGEALRLLEQAIRAPLPLVLDADALNLLASDGRLEGHLYTRIAPVILTPHPAEAARLLACSVSDVQRDRVAAATRLACATGACVVLKGCGSIVALPDGRWWINTTGNPGMATAGMGDVLTGLIAALLAQGWPAEAATLAGVHLHGAAADRLVASGIGPVGLTAGEVIDAARAVFNRWLA